MLKKIFSLLLCAACLLAAATLAVAEGEQTESEFVISDEDSFFTGDSEPSDVSEPPAILQPYIGLEFTDTDLLIFVTDESGQPVPFAPLAFDVGSTVNMITTVANDAGAAVISIVGLDPGTAIVCHSAEFSTESVTYLSAETSAAVPGEIPTTTTVTASTTTETAPPTTAPTAVTTLAPLPTLPTSDATGTTRSMPTYAEVRGATTTRVQGSEVYTNLLIDEHLLKEFGLSIGRFDQVGRLIVEREIYTSLTETYGSHLFGKLTTSVLPEITVDEIRAAKKDVSAFADCKPENATTLTFAASLQFLDENGAGLPVTDASSLGSDLMFEFSLPVPKSMENCKAFGIAMTGENVLAALTPIAANNGVISFRTPALGHFTLIGFTDGKPAGGSALNTLMWVLIGLGVLMFALMGFLIYRFFIRGRGDDPDDPEDGGFGFDSDDDNDDGNGTGGGDADADEAPSADDAPAETAADAAPEEPLLAADGTPLDVEALKQSWMEEDRQVQAILRDMKKSRREPDEATR